MHRVTLALLGLLALSACHSTPTSAPAATLTDKQAPLANAEQEPDKITGSRIARKSSDRMIKSVGAREARDALETQPTPLKSN